MIACSALTARLRWSQEVSQNSHRRVAILIEICLGSRGLGLHTATAFLLAGAKKVFISARKNEGDQGIDQAVERLNKLPVSGQAVGIAANVADTADIARLVKKVQETDGVLDILVCNAGATWGGPFDPTPDWASEKVLNLNVRGVFNLARLYVGYTHISTRH